MSGLNQQENNDYIFHRELPTGKGFADLVLIPRKNGTSSSGARREDYVCSSPVKRPTLVIELKCDRDADSAIDQIKRRQYTAKLEQYTGNIPLVGISHDRDSKIHTCQIEKA